MYDSIPFGTILRRAREERREDLLSVARKVRIRPDILEAIENSDFDNMPPRGYARNMINAYARYLGLNPTEVVKLYLSSQYDHQVSVDRANARPSGFDMTGGSRGSVGPRGTAPSSDYFGGAGMPEPARYPGRRSTAPRDTLDSQIDSALTMQMNPVGRRPVSNSRRPDEEMRDYVNRYTTPDQRRFGGGKMAIAAAVGILLAVGIGIAVVSTMSKAPSKDKSDEPAMIITGMPGSENHGTIQNDTQTAPPSVAIAPVKTVIGYTVAEGQSAYIEISVGGSYVFADYANGPKTDSFDVSEETGELVFVTTNPEAVKLTQDGKPVELSSNDNGIASKTFKFQDVLDAWNAEQEAASQQQAQAGADSSAANGASSSTSSSNTR